MSRVGKKTIPLSEKTEVAYNNRIVTVKGVKGTLSQKIHPSVDLKIDQSSLNVVLLESGKKADAVQGLMRSLLFNMVKGVTHGFERTLEINGIGYRAELNGSIINLSLGYSHPIGFNLPDGVTAIVEKNTIIKLFGIDKEKLGQTAASIRKLRPPEPYKGKGIKYAEEFIQRKAGKTGTK